MIKAVLDKLKADRPKLVPLRVWRAYALLDEYKANELTALVALIYGLWTVGEAVKSRQETLVLLAYCFTTSCVMKRNDVGKRRRFPTVVSPCLHESPPLLEHIAAPVRLLLMTCASAASTISFWNEVRSLAQVLNVARKPCTVRSSRPIRRNSIRNAMLESGVPTLGPGNTNALGFSP